MERGGDRSGGGEWEWEVREKTAGWKVYVEYMKGGEERV